MNNKGVVGLCVSITITGCLALIFYTGGHGLFAFLAAYACALLLVAFVLIFDVFRLFSNLTSVEPRNKDDD